MSEATSAAETAQTFPEHPEARVWKIHTVESWARAIIDDIAKEVESSEGTAVDFTATWRGVQFDDGSFGAAIQIKSCGTYNVHGVRIS